MSGAGILPARGLEPRSPEAPNESESAARTITRAALHAILLRLIRKNLHRDLTESFIRIRLRIIRHGVGVPQILADRFERLHLLLPCFREIRFSAGARRNPFEYARRNWILVH